MSARVLASFGGFVTVAVALDAEAWCWIEARAAKAGTSPEVEAGRLLQRHLANRAAADRRLADYRAERDRRREAKQAETREQLEALFGEDRLTRALRFAETASAALRGPQTSPPRRGRRGSGAPRNRAPGLVGAGSEADGRRGG